MAWHVDELKVLHKDPFEVNKFSQYLSAMYGGQLKVHGGNMHDYLVIYCYYSETGVPGKSFDDKMPSEGSRRVYRRVMRNISHPRGRSYVPSYFEVKSKKVMKL